MDLVKLIGEALKLPDRSVQQTLDLLDQGNTVPFIARYRKEATGNLDEVAIRHIAAEAERLRALAARKEEVRRLIAAQGKLTAELEAAINTAPTLQAVEDQYRPYRPRRRTRADIARERGLQLLADALLAGQARWEQLQKMAAAAAAANPDIEGVAGALAGAADIVAEQVADDPSTRDEVRTLTLRKGTLVVKSNLPKERTGERTAYESYYSFTKFLRDLRPHQVLAINRGEREDILIASVQAPETEITAVLQRRWVRSRDSQVTGFLAATLQDAYARLLAPSVEREIRHMLTDTADRRAIEVFARNLEALLMQPPVRGMRVLGIDPGYRTGSKLAVVDETGRLLTTGAIYPHPPQNCRSEAEDTIRQLIVRWQIALIVIGNGTAARETEEMVASIVDDFPDMRYLIVSEAGASVYSASELARSEFPELDVSERGTVSIARRVQDPLAELVKIDPKSIGVGQYQHDVDQKALAATLGQVVESCVNRVGVHVNTASPSLLQYVAGVNATISKRIVEYRDANGPFACREDLLKVKGMGPKTYEQAAGFLRIPDGVQPLDGTAVHPESYQVAMAILQEVGLTPNDLHRESAARDSLRNLDPALLADRLGTGVPTVTDIIAALLRPGLDPRSELSPTPFRRDVLHIEDVRPGMRLTGTVQNVVDFGAFVDLGLKKAGLIHVSHMGGSYVKHPLDVVSVGQPVTVDVLEVDLERNRIALALVHAE